jgi:hypothetical protein
MLPGTVSALLPKEQGYSKEKYYLFVLMVLEPARESRTRIQLPGN